MQSSSPIPTHEMSGSVQDWVQNSLPLERPLGLHRETASGPRITLFTDCLAPSSMFGAAGTSVLLAAWWAEEASADLRVVTMKEPVTGDPVRDLVQLQGVRLSQDVSYERISGDDWNLSLQDQDRILCTSWWTARLLRRSGVNPEQIVCLLQEDEHLLVPNGDAWLRCQETLHDPGLRVVVNSRFLYESFREDGYSAHWHDSAWFEPAFPTDLYHTASRISEHPRFGFYARPHHDRNLFLRGLEAVQAALDCGAIPSDWELVFLGPEPLDIVMTGGQKPRCPGRLSWEEYAAEIRQLHAGMALILTPHPGYPALDMVASGAAVVSNRYGPKQDLSVYNGNLFTADPSEDGLVKGIKLAVERSRDPGLLAKHLETCGLSRDWSDSFRQLGRVLGV